MNLNRTTALAPARNRFYKCIAVKRAEKFGLHANIRDRVTENVGVHRRRVDVLGG